ncbi:MAG TPA: magnesium/cobalt transporter CorA [Chloroflexota bacterium]
MIAQVITRSGDDGTATLEVEDGSAVERVDNGSLAWIDIVDPSNEDVEWLRQRFHLHPMAARDIIHHHQRPKLDDYGDIAFGVLYAVGEPSNGKRGKRVQMRELQFIWHAERLVTIHWSPVPAIEELTERVRGGSLKATVGRTDRELRVEDIAYELFDAVVDAYFPALDSLAEGSERLEEEMFSSRRSSATLESIFNLKKDLFHMRKVIAPARDVINVLLRRDHKLFPEEYFPYFQDLYDRTNRVIDGLDTYRDLLSSSMDTYLSFVSNDVNQTVKRMTAVTAILMVDALIAGVYGMNFENMPELHWQYGYFYALALLAIATAALWLLFRRIRWF